MELTVSGWIPGSVSLNYYGLMVPLHRCLRLAALSTALAASHGVMAQPTPPDASRPGQETPAEPPAASELDGELFYDILMGEITAQSGEPATGYALMLEAARRGNQSQLYQRATEIALQSRSGDAALAAARAWRDAFPESREANRYVLQILIALNRIDETPELLQRELAQNPAPAKLTLLNAIPQMYARASDKLLVAKVVEQALENELLQPATGTSAWIVLGRVRLAAGDRKAAMEAAQRAYQQAPGSDGVTRLALELLDEGEKDAEALVLQHLSKATPATDIRVGYSRVLVGLQRYAEARAQLLSLTKDQPDLPEAWLLLATLQLQANDLSEAQSAANRFIELNTRTPDEILRERGFTQAYLLQAQIAEKQEDYAAAERWLNRIDNSNDVFGAQVRRASLLARRGKMPEARALLRQLPGRSTDERRLKLLAEVQLLKDAKLYQDAYKVQSEAVALNPDDGDLVYEQAMLAEKAGDATTMEKLLRTLIAKQPDNHHALNGLGYSLADRGVRLPEAKELIQRALALAPGDAFITDSLGWVEFRLGNVDEAARLLRQAYATRADVEIAAHLGEVLWRQGDRTGAQTVWKEGLAINPDNEVLRETLKRFNILR